MPLKKVRFVENPLSYNQLNISRADIPCVLENYTGETARSKRPVTLNITVNITPSNLHNSPPSIPTEDDNCPTEEATVPPERVQIISNEHNLPLSNHQPVSTGNTMPQSQEMSPSAESPRFALNLADESMKRIGPIDGSNTWERAVGRIKWVMDTLGPVAEVRVIPF